MVTSKIKKNIGEKDKKIRIILGLILFVISFLIKPPISLLFIILGLVLLITAFTGFCGLYVLLGINTCKINN